MYSCRERAGVSKTSTYDVSPRPTERTKNTHHVLGKRYGHRLRLHVCSTRNSSTSRKTDIPIYLECRRADFIKASEGNTWFGNKYITSRTCKHPRSEIQTVSVITSCPSPSRSFRTSAPAVRARRSSRSSFGRYRRAYRSSARRTF